MNVTEPQWLCDCNIHGEHETLEEAGIAAGKHFLGHATQEGYRDGTVSVTVYRKRGEWAYTLTTWEQAEKAAFPLRAVTTTLTANFTSLALNTLTDNAYSAATASEGLTMKKMDALIDTVEANYYRDRLEKGAAVETITINPLAGPPKAYRLTETDYRENSRIDGYAEPVILENPASGTSGSRFREAQRRMMGYFDETMPSRKIEG